MITDFSPLLDQIIATCSEMQDDITNLQRSVDEYIKLMEKA